uniref:3-hydroxyisobutyrate dehydrogenase n=1 Tax=Sphingomonas sp. JE1 TaxID=1628059 RepID=A0A0D5A0B3_9SPHN|nr:MULTISPECIES: NAD(P)-dependent oxidoreductase [unclassified Sphingomonas]AJW29596.1 3-hydroxyisobutyrate dehydrogenase [Sphingomonas sp. JE1]
MNETIDSKPEMVRRRVAFIGLGSMGGALADRAVAAGHDCVVHDKDTATMERFRDRALLVSSAREAAEQSDIVVACLAAAAHYDAVLTGPDGIVSAGKRLVYVHAGTSSVPMVRAWTEQLAAADIAMLDAPVTGGVGRAKAGDLTVMVAGPLQSYEFAEQVLRSYASKLVYFGEAAGAAQTMKLVNNMLNFANLAAAAEIMVIGTKAGLDPEKMLDVINHGSGQNSATLAKFPNHILTGTFDYQGWISHVLKDGRAFLDEAADMAVPAPLSAAVYQAFVHAFAVGDGRKDYDITEVIRYMEQAAGVEVRRK